MCPTSARLDQCYEVEDRRRIQPTRAESGENGTVEGEGQSDQLCYAAGRSRKETDTW